MKRIFIIYLILIGTNVFCQVGGVGISPNGGSPDPSAALDIKYTNKGLLMPRLTTVQMDSISAPAKGLLVFNSDSNAFYYYNGSIWASFSSVFLPTVINTTAASSITANTAVSGGIVSSNGGAAVTAYGVCWGTSPNPVLGGGNYTTDGTGTGVFTSSNITGLIVGTTYYVRAYATNSVGTAYAPQISFTTVALTIGATFGGGIVAYILQPGDAGYNANVQHGLIAAASDQSSGIVWDNPPPFPTIGSTSTAIGTGASNTAAIIATIGTGNCGCYAASACTTYTGGGYTNWYLPSENELEELYLNKAAIGGFTTTAYWSSSEDNNTTAWFVNFGNNAQNGDVKNATLNVRAVRSF